MDIYTVVLLNTQHMIEIGHVDAPQFFAMDGCTSIVPPEIPCANALKIHLHLLSKRSPLCFLALSLRILESSAMSRVASEELVGA